MCRFASCYSSTKKVYEHEAMQLHAFNIIQQSICLQREKRQPARTAHRSCRSAGIGSAIAVHTAHTPKMALALWLWITMLDHSLLEFVEAIWSLTLCEAGIYLWAHGCTIQFYIDSLEAQ